MMPLLRIYACDTGALVGGIPPLTGADFVPGQAAIDNDGRCLTVFRHDGSQDVWFARRGDFEFAQRYARRRGMVRVWQS